MRRGARLCMYAIHVPEVQVRLRVLEVKLRMQLRDWKLARQRAEEKLERDTCTLGEHCFPF